MLVTLDGIEILVNFVHSENAELAILESPVVCDKSRFTVPLVLSRAVLILLMVSESIGPVTTIV